MNYETVIGLEVHVQLATRTKMFCACRAEFGAEPNTLVCPVCLGLPGALPVVNKRAFDHAIKAALAFHAKVARHTKFDRKNYFYPDLPKAYQISQFDMPYCAGGWLEIGQNGDAKRIGITRIHLEEDAGKLLHSTDHRASAVDLNRCGTPLLEIVSEPDLRSPAEAHQYLTNLKLTLKYLGVSDCNMEEGSLRCDANVSIRPVGQEKFGVKVEIKNLNSFRAVEKALAHEVVRHREVIEAGGTIRQETRLWDEAAGVTRLLRSKEQAHDYRYFPDPDLPVVEIGEAWVREVAAEIPELPLAKIARYQREMGLSRYDAEVICDEQPLSLFFDETARLFPDSPKKVANWVTQDFKANLNARRLAVAHSPVTPARLAELIRLVEQGEVQKLKAKEILEAMFDDDRPVEAIVDSRGGRAVRDAGAMESLAEKAIAAAPRAWQDYLGGKEAALKSLVGQCMKLSRGAADPKALPAIFERIRARPHAQPLFPKP
ncbi:MAG: Asp-tRNA(Asn)/Glu-tRNA(Gln) amidotransferase subunit GatB [Planctomycetes bacterium]|nr:Asp-tRNA(Asn)/Glu-tRNA(Gln) amidotransferase subunit GatB [Planctomycetota bacterium]